MIYKAKLRFVTNKTRDGFYTQMELVMLRTAFKFGEAEDKLIDIIKKDYSPKDDIVRSLSMSIVSYEGIIELEEDEIDDNKDYKFYETKVEFALHSGSKLTKKVKTYLIQEYSMDAAKKKAQLKADKNKKIMFDKALVKKITETDIFEIYI